MVNLHIGNVLTSIEGELSSAIKIHIKEQTAYSIQGAEYSTYGAETYCPICKRSTENLTYQESLGTPKDGYKYRRCLIHGIVRPISLWDGRKFLYDGRSASFPTGLVGRVVDVLRQNGIQYKIIDERIAPYTRKLSWHGPQLRYYQKDAVTTLIKKTRGVIQGSVGCGKCWKRDQGVLMADGSIKKIQDIVPNDLVMGSDGRPRTVAEVHSGTEKLYKVEYVGAGTYFVTGNHILTLKKAQPANLHTSTQQEIIDISVLDFVSSTEDFKKSYKGFYGKVDTFYRPQEAPLLVDPYNFGAWLVGGNCGTSPINSETLDELGVSTNKQIPNQYLYASYQSRCKLVAGILDGIGAIYKTEITVKQENSTLRDQIIFLMRSVGLIANKIDENTVGVYGDFSDIPTKLKNNGIILKNNSLFDVVITEDAYDQYFGFSVKEEDKHFLLADFAVVHNSNILAALTAEVGVNTLVLAHSSTVFHQLYNTFKSCLKLPIGRIGDGYSDPAKITIAMPQSLVGTIKVPKRKLVKGKWTTVNTNVAVIKDQYKDFLLGTEALFVDECHRIACNTVQLVANSCVNAFFRIGVSATPYRADLLDILIESTTGRVNYKYTSTQAIKDGYLSRPTIHLVSFKQSPYPRKKQVTTVDEKTGIAVTKTVPVKYVDLYNDRVVRNEQRNLLIANIAYKHFIKNESVLVIVRVLEHGEDLYNKLKYLGKSVCWVNGENDSEELKAVLKKLNTGECKICIASGIFNEGVDITGLNVCINTTACDSPVTAMQILGRTLRRTSTKTEVDFYDIADKGVRWLSPHAENREEMYRTEEAFIIKKEDSEKYLTD